MKYKIGELAKLLGVSTNTVRRYEDMGYISAVRDENSGYRYYNDDDIFSVMNAKMHVKYGFSHEQISQMQSFSLEETIDAYKKRMDELDKQIAYMTYLRHRLKDDYLLMNKAATYSDIYEKMSLTMYTCLLYTSDAADEEDSVDLGGRRNIKKKKKEKRRKKKKKKKRK